MITITDLKESLEQLVETDHHFDYEVSDPGLAFYFKAEHIKHANGVCLQAFEYQNFTCEIVDYVKEAERCSLLITDPATQEQFVLVNVRMPDRSKIGYDEGHPITIKFFCMDAENMKLPVIVAKR